MFKNSKAPVKDDLSAEVQNDYIESSRFRYRLSKKTIVCLDPKPIGSFTTSGGICIDSVCRCPQPSR